MKKLFFLLSFVILAYFIFGFYLAIFELTIYETGTEPQKHPLFHDYRGVSHVVTSHSKGSLSPSTILLSADKANLSFLFFTDLNLMERPYELTGYHGDVFSFSGQKLGYLDAHILVYSKNPSFYFHNMGLAHAHLHEHFSEPPNAEKNFMAVLAHPFKLNHSWTGPYPLGMDGIEVINMHQLWQKLWLHDRFSFVWSLLTYPWNSKLALLRLIKEPKRELELWDYLNREKPTLGFLGNQTTARIFHVLGLNFAFPSYEASFNFASNHILLSSELTGHGGTDGEKIYSALKKGHFYFAFDALGKTEGFASYIKKGTQHHLMGSKLKMGKTPHFLITELPRGLKVPTMTQVYRNGKLAFQSSESRSQWELKQPGHYRVVVKVQAPQPFFESDKKIGWIYTNPFFLSP